MTAPTAHELAEQLRNAGAWLELAAQRLDEGNLDEGRTMASLGTMLAEPLPGRLAELASTVTS